MKLITVTTILLTSAAAVKTMSLPAQLTPWKEASHLQSIAPPCPNAKDSHIPMALAFDPPYPNPKDPHIPMALAFDPPYPNPKDPHIPMALA